MSKKAAPDPVLDTLEPSTTAAVSVDTVVNVATVALEVIEQILDLCKHTRAQGGDPAKLAESIMSRLGG